MLWELPLPSLRSVLLPHSRRLLRPYASHGLYGFANQDKTRRYTTQQDAFAALGPEVDGEHKPQTLRHATLLNDNRKATDEGSASAIRLRGIVRSVRKQKRAIFASISDGSTSTPYQAFLTTNVENAQSITNGAYVELVGKWQESRGQGQSHELAVDRIVFIGESNPDVYPIQKQALTHDYLRTIPHLRMRTPFQSLIARARSQLIRDAHNLMNPEEPNNLQAATYVQPPTITSSDCEGAGEVFTIAPRTKTATLTSAETGQETDLYFREPKYLTVSSQLHLEAYCAELDRVWTLSPAFRAEESDTPRHLAEFTMLEVELRLSAEYISALDASNYLMWLIKSLTEALRASRVGKELLIYHGRTSSSAADTISLDSRPDLEERWSKVTSSWQLVTYTHAINALKNADEKDASLFKYKPNWDSGLQLEHERWIVDVMNNGKPTLVFNYPKKIKPFYMLPSTLTNTASQPTDDDQVRQQTVACFDLLLPYGYCEVAGGSLREHRLEQLIQNMREKGLLKQATKNDSNYPFLRPGESLGNLQWYADLRRFSSSPHGGFGMGFDRLLAYLTGASNIRDVVGFPRAWGRADC